MFRSEADSVGLRLAHAHRQLGAWLADSIEQIDQTGNRGECRLQRCSVFLELVQIRPEQLYLDGPRRPGKVVDHVRENLDEIDVQPRHRRGDFDTHFIDYLENGSGPLTLWLEAHSDVAPVLLGRKQPQLCAGAARGCDDLWRLRQNSLNDVHFAISL